MRIKIASDLQINQFINFKFLLERKKENKKILHKWNYYNFLIPISKRIECLKEIITIIYLYTNRLGLEESS